MADPHFPLRGLRVLEWADGIAAPFAARLLADAGAEVVKVEPPEGDSARREGPFPDDRPDLERSGFFAYLNRGKRSIVLDQAMAAGREHLRRLLGAADIFVYDRPELVKSALGASAAALRSTSPRLIAVSLTPFGERGPHAGRRADDLIVVSAGGLAFATPGFPDHVAAGETDPPLHPNTNLGQLVGGLVAAVGATFALLNRDRTGRGDVVEVSQQEALAGMLFWDLGMYSYGGAVIGRHPVRTRLTPNHYLPIADGWAVIVAFLDGHWRALLDLMGNPDWASDPRFATAVSRGDHWTELEPLLLSWLLDQSGQALFERAQGRGIPCAPALSMAEALGNEQVTARRFLVPAGLTGDARGRLPGSVYVVDGERRPTAIRFPALGADTAEVLAQWLDGSAAQAPAAGGTAAGNAAILPLSGIRVIDLGQLVAIPTAGQALAFLGAEVIVVESRSHPISRSFAPFAGEPAHDTSGLFNQINRNKRSCTLNLRTLEGRALAKRLAAMADVVIENFSPGTMEKLGLGYEELHALKPDLIMVSLSAAGHTGPWRNVSALHSGIILLSGLAAVTGYEDGYPRIVGSILPDPIAGAYCVLATAQALYYRNRTGCGQHIEVAMTETIQSLLPEAILEYTMLGREARRIGNRHPWKTPHGIYRAQGEDRWLAISVSNEEEWRAFCRVIGLPALAEDPRFADRAARWANHTALDPLIAAWSRELPAEDAAERLQRAGIMASAVYNARDVLTDGHMRERGFIQEDRHPRAGSHPMTTAPWHFSEMAPIAYRPAPLLGADNEYVFGRLLGLSPSEVSRLEADRVVY